MSLSHSFLFYGASFFCSEGIQRVKLKSPKKTKQNSRAQTECQSRRHSHTSTAGRDSTAAFACRPHSAPGWVANLTQAQQIHRLGTDYTHTLAQTIPELDNELGQFEGSQQKGDLPLSFAWRNELCDALNRCQIQIQIRIQLQIQIQIRIPVQMQIQIRRYVAQQQLRLRLCPHISAEIHSDALRTLTPQPRSRSRSQVRVRPWCR